MTNNGHQREASIKAGLPGILTETEPELTHHEEGPGLGSFKAYYGNCLDAGKVIDRGSVSLVFTSPPYPGVDQPTDNYVTFPDPQDFNSFHDFLHDVWEVCYNLLADEGRLVVNIYDIPKGASGMYPNVARVIKDCLSIGYVLREDYIWHKGASYSPPVGSWPLPKGVLSGNTYEHMIVFQKPLQFAQRKINPKDYPENVKEASTLGATEHAWLMDPVWKIKADHEARKMGHPFPFPIELPERFIKLYTMATDTVFDPFGGAGTTALAAQKLGRHGVITELSKDFIDLIDVRTNQGSMF